MYIAKKWEKRYKKIHHKIFVQHVPKKNFFTIIILNDVAYKFQGKLSAVISKYMRTNNQFCIFLRIKGPTRKTTACFIPSISHLTFETLLDIYPLFLTLFFCSFKSQSSSVVFVLFTIWLLILFKNVFLFWGGSWLLITTVILLWPRHKMNSFSVEK